MVRLLAFCTVAFGVFLVTNALVESTPRTHQPALEKKRRSLLDLRDVPCGGNTFCPDGDKCIPNNLCCPVADTLQEEDVVRPVFFALVMVAARTAKFAHELCILHHGLIVSRFGSSEYASWAV
ncbi:hypothetical protein BU17DRAFT_66210 [Hysterangium stoloniferum]|nr:hypothetical protein BU17DRAFT_66210 [Hysterangium stoloniferum]